MWFLSYIITYLTNARDRFLDAYYTVSGWVYPFSLLATPLYYLYYAFFYIAYYFGEFNTWLTWAAGRINAILDTSAIYSYFKSYFDYAVNAWNWVYNAVGNVWSIVGSWWSSQSQVVLSWIADAKTYAAALFSSASASLSSLRGQWDDFRTTTLPGLVNSITVDNMIRTWFTNAAPLWSGWQEARDKVYAFIDTPFDWLLSKFTDWFLGSE